jgi:hypothetical protein
MVAERFMRSCQATALRRGRAPFSISAVHFSTLSVSLRGHELDNLLFLTKGFPLFLVSGKGLLHPAYGTMTFSKVDHCMLLSSLK